MQHVTSFSLHAHFTRLINKVVEVNPELESVFPGITEMTNDLKVRTRSYRNSYKKTYFPEDLYCANVIRSIRLMWHSNTDLEHVVSVVSSA